MSGQPATRSTIFAREDLTWYQAALPSAPSSPGAVHVSRTRPLPMFSATRSVTAAGGALATHWILQWDWTRSVLFGTLVIVTGPTGSGKSTTLAAVIDVINKSRSCHIPSIEDPIEYSHESIKVTVDQRELFADTKSFAAALKYILRQDPGGHDEQANGGRER